MSPTFRSLANRNYRRYAAGGVVSNTGTWMQRVAQDWLVLQLSGNSGTAIGITTGLQFLPFLLMAPFAGLVADRMPKHRLLQLTNVAMAAPALWRSFCQAEDLDDSVQVATCGNSRFAGRHGTASESLRPGVTLAALP